MSIIKSFYQGGVTSGLVHLLLTYLRVVASDCPKEFRLRRDRIAEMLFSCKQISWASKESKMNNSGDDIDDHGDMNVNRVLRNYSFSEAEALTDEMEEESDTIV
ncbi:hypothetical protein AHAS_Ahas03G0316900 [Arachis hypogaea]